METGDTTYDKLTRYGFAAVGVIVVGGFLALTGWAANWFFKIFLPKYAASVPEKLDRVSAQNDSMMAKMELINSKLDRLDADLELCREQDKMRGK